MEANAASVAILRAGDVLLIQRAGPPYAGLWTLPGGRVEAGETGMVAARREIGEELGLELGRLVPLTVLAATAHWRLQVFAARFPGGDIRPSGEIAAWRWSDPGAAAALAVTPGLAEVLALALRAAPALT